MKKIMFSTEYGLEQTVLAGTKPHTLPKVSIDPSLLEQHPRMFER